MGTRPLWKSQNLVPHCLWYYLLKSAIFSSSRRLEREGDLRDILGLTDITRYIVVDISCSTIARDDGYFIVTLRLQDEGRNDPKPE